MRTGIKVELGVPESGWARLSVSHDDQAFSIDASYTPYDWVADLTQAVAMIAKGIDEATVSMCEEPCEYDMEFRRADELVSVSIISYPDHRRPARTGRREFGYQGPLLQVCLAFWRALRRLESQVSSADFERAWRHPFPSEKLQELTQIVQQMETGRPDRRRSREE